MRGEIPDVADAHPGYGAVPALGLHLRELRSRATFPALLSRNLDGSIGTMRKEVDAGKSMAAPSAADGPATYDAGDFVVGKRMGSFTDLAAANRLVNAALLRNRDSVDSVAEGRS